MFGSLCPQFQATLPTLLETLGGFKLLSSYLFCIKLLAKWLSFTLGNLMKTLALYDEKNDKM